MKFRELLVILATGVIVLGAAAIAEQTGPSFFSDVADDHDHFWAIDTLFEEGYIQGYPDGTFRPEQTINRAEYLKIVLGTSDYEPGGENCYPDVEQQWFAPYVCKATELGFVQGNPDGLFHPDRPIVFAEASKIVANIHALDLEAGLDEAWYHRYVKALEDKAAIPGKISGFDQEVTRAQMAEVVWRIKDNRREHMSNTYANIKRGLEAGRAVQEDLVAFESCSLLKDHLLENKQSSRYGNDDYFILEQAEVDAVAPQAAKSETSAGDLDFSTTNVQVAGVDEADIVKNDASHIYVLKGRTVRIVKAYEPELIEEVSIIDLTNDDFTPRDMYVDGDQLVVLGEVQDYGPYEDVEAYLSLDIDPYFYYGNRMSKVYVLDITDRGEPSIEREVTIEGELNSSRKVDGTVYIVSERYNHAVSINNDTEPAAANLIPRITDSNQSFSEPAVGCGDVLYHPGDIEDNYTIITALPLNGAATNSASFLGSSGDIFASRNNIYITEYAGNWYPYSSDLEKTMIHKFSLDGTQITNTAKGAVPGTVLNQFSMDEYKDNFRIVTTVGNLWDEENPKNTQLYILNENLDQLGKVTNIAPTENLHSVRFMGDRAYLVTFKKVDPLFTVDVSDPANPEIMGELKIPGFSDYLHPYDENHIIGFGLDTIEAEDFIKEQRNLDFAWYQGVKIAMFDVTDFDNPKQLHVEIIGDRGSDTPLRFNHKALLFAHGKGSDASKALMSLPIRLAEITEDDKTETIPDFPPYGTFVGQYAYVYDVSVEDGFELQGKITHHKTSDVDLEDHYSYSRAERNINRILYIGDYLYTVSRALVRANDRDNVDRQIKQVLLKDLGDEPNYWWY